MDFALLLKFIEVVVREVWQRKFVCLFGFAVASFLVLLVGMFWPSKFEASATIFADNQNILRPLLQNQAAQSDVLNQTKVVRDTMHSPRILNRVIDEVFANKYFESAEEKGVFLNTLRSKIKIQGLGAAYIKVSYTDKTASDAYRVINALIDIFIRSSAEEQKSESREAFLFIDNQVTQYKDQLLLAEERLKDFRSFNFDGRDGDVDSSISRLRDQIEELKISIDEDKTIIASLTNQLADESEFSAKRYKADVYSQRLELLEERMATLLLSYTEDYPDVVSLKYQIEDIKNTIKETNEAKKSTTSNDDEVVLNPLYQELRSRLSQSRTEVTTKGKRLVALNGLLSNEYERRKRIAERGAEEAELTRDYTVTRRIYEDMLERKEKARLSMTLNIEGQGVTYRIQEPALPPLNPTGLRFLHFVLAGPILGTLFVLGAIVLFTMLDPRIRFSERLSEFNVPVLAVVPHVSTPFTKRVVKVDIIICFIASIAIMASYIGLAYASKSGLIL